MAAVIVVAAAAESIDDCPNVEESAVAVAHVWVVHQSNRQSPMDA